MMIHVISYHHSPPGNLLGYNYQSSKWYEASYKILNTDYERRKITAEDEKDSLVDKFKNLFK